MSEIAIQSNYNMSSTSAKSSPKYTINVIFTGPQVVDKKSTFYVQDHKYQRTRRSNSTIISTPKGLKQFSKEESEFDKFITTKLIHKKDIDEVLDDEIFKKFFKK